MGDKRRKHERTLSLKRKRFIGKRYVNIFKDGGWREYNERLVKRGEILIDVGFLEDMEKELEELNKGKRGRPYRYSDGLFTFLGYLYALARYRMLEGICRAFSKIVRGFPVPDHSTIHRRLNASLPKVEVDGNMLIVDSTGFRLERAPGYVEYRHKLRRRKKWIKLHIITDGKKVVKLKDIDLLIGDPAYDSRENFNLIAKYGIKALIKVRKNSTNLAKGSPPRREAVIEQRDRSWSKKSGYSKLFSWMKPSFLKKVLFLIYFILFKLLILTHT